MANPPNFENLSVHTNSKEVDECLYVAFKHDYDENDRLLMVLGEQRDELEAKVRWLEDLVTEGEHFLLVHENGEIGLEGLKESLERERKVLADLIKVMDSAREGREEKKVNVSWFESSSDC